MDREAAGRKIFENGGVKKLSISKYEVQSQSKPEPYVVEYIHELGKWVCRCTNFMRNDPERCKHRWALEHFWNCEKAKCLRVQLVIA